MVRTDATLTLKISSTAFLISSLPAVRSTRKVNTWPFRRSLFSSVESSLRIMLFSVTTGAFKMSQTVTLLISRGLLICRSFFLGRFWFCRPLCLWLLFDCRGRRHRFLDRATLASWIEKLIQLFDRGFRDQKL